MRIVPSSLFADTSNRKNNSNAFLSFSSLQSHSLRRIVVSLDMGDPSDSAPLMSVGIVRRRRRLWLFAPPQEFGDGDGDSDGSVVPGLQDVRRSADQILNQNNITFTTSFSLN